MHSTAKVPHGGLKIKLKQYVLLCFSNKQGFKENILCGDN